VNKKRQPRMSVFVKEFSNGDTKQKPKAKRRRRK
jgi:hypothetical protein